MKYVFTIIFAAAIILGVSVLQTFAKKINIIETPSHLQVQFSGDNSFQVYPIHDRELKAKLLVNDKLWSYRYEFNLPNSVDAFLISQFIDGGVIYINGNKISELPKSDQARKFIWFRPHLVYVPEKLKQSSHTHSVIRIESASYLRYSYIMPVYAGNFFDIQILSDILFFISRTLSVASSIVTLVASVLLLATWHINKQDRLFFNAGLAAVTWASLYLLLNFPSIPSDTVKFFRFAMYALIAISICNLTLYLAQLSCEKASANYRKIILITSAAGPMIFAISLGKLQHIVDSVWIGGMFAIMLPAFYRFFKKLIKNDLTKSNALGCVLLIGFIAAYRDYQFIGFERIIYETRGANAWDLLDAPMLISYIVVPMVFIVSAGRLLQNYKQSLQIILQHNTELEIALQKRELQLHIAHLEDMKKKQRDISEITRASIHRDLHDGIGSRLVATTYALRAGKLTREKLENSLINCLKDIRAIMQSDVEQDVQSLQTVLFEYCSDMEEILSNTNVKLNYMIPDDREVCLLGNKSGEILKMIQELLSNAIKHSAACDIQICMKLSDSYLTITVIETNFIIGNTSASETPALPSSNTGLKSLELRAQSIGATFLQQVTPTERSSFIALRMFVDQFLYLSDALPAGREARRQFLSSQISDLI